MPLLHGRLHRHRVMKWVTWLAPRTAFGKPAEGSAAGLDELEQLRLQVGALWQVRMNGMVGPGPAGEQDAGLTARFEQSGSDLGSPSIQGRVMAAGCH